MFNKSNKTNPCVSGLQKQPETQHVGVGEDVRITAVFKGDAPAQVVNWQSRISAGTDSTGNARNASAWEDLVIDNLKITTSAIIYDTEGKTSTSTLVINTVSSQDEKDYHGTAVYTTGSETFYVTTDAISVIIKCESQD